MSTRKSIFLRVMSPEGIIHEYENLTAVNIPLVNGYTLGVRPGHAPIIGETRQGKIVYRSNTSESQLELHGGVFELRNDEITIFAAGEVIELDSDLSSPTEISYDRLMQNLLGKMNLNE